MSKLLSIIIHPNPILRKKSKEINEKEISSHEFQELCLDMAKTMQEEKGVGLAAPQVNKNIRLIVVNAQDGPITMINPKILKKSWAKEWNEEGCLSIPGVYGEVKRAKKINCTFLDKKGKKIKMQANGLMAYIIQHEIDHLDGVLFIDKARNIKKVNMI